MFARAVTIRRITGFLIAALVAVSGCGGGEAQDADEPEGTFRLELAGATFPAAQSIADQATMRIRVRNPDRRTVPNVAVTVQTKGARPGAGEVAFAQSKDDPRLADPNRPVWVLDREPKGGTSAYANTWTLGPLESGETKTFEWRLTAVEAGDYSVSYRIAPGLDGRARLASGSKARGSFDVTISDDPVPARVDGEGNVVRGEKAGAGKD
ncbi:MAG: hypothetical protein ACRDK0_05935 [Solirubrobacteraceae bacterium]